jgi:voltage-gated sodium channel
MRNYRERLGSFLEGRNFQSFIVTLIIINSITIGMETSKTWMYNYGSWFDYLDNIILGIFVVELFLKVYAFRLQFFTSTWNLFDFVIVTIALIPSAGPFAIFRTMRILRTLRLLKNVPNLRLIIDALFRSIPSIGWIMVLLLIVYYIFAVLATNLYGDAFPEWFGNIGKSFYSLFQVMTLESWSSGIARPMMKEIPYSNLFFIPFILIATYIGLNIFVAIVVNTMNEMKLKTAKENKDEMHDQIMREHEETQNKLEILSKQLATLNKKIFAHKL